MLRNWQLYILLAISALLRQNNMYKTIYNVFIYLFIYMEKDDLSKFWIYLDGIDRISFSDD